MSLPSALHTHAHTFLLTDAVSRFCIMMRYVAAVFNRPSEIHSCIEGCTNDEIRPTTFLLQCKLTRKLYTVLSRYRYIDRQGFIKTFSQGGQTIILET